MNASGLMPVVTFWHGPLSWLERLCLGSFVRHGHPVLLYAYEPIAGLPAGVEPRDAAEIVPKERLVLYKGRGTPAVFSDFFRLKLLERGLGVWADADVYCVQPIIDPPDYFFGYERPGSINNAVLRLPAGSALLADLIGVFDDGRRPLLEPHLPLVRRLEVAARRLFGGKVAPHDMQFGATGPMALTHFAGKHGLLDRVQPVDVFYPVPYAGIPSLLAAGSSLDTAITPRTLGVHLWRSQLTDRGRRGIAAPEPGSALAGLCERDGVEVG